MGLETAAFVSDLNAANPVATDGLGQADDHMRLIKTVLKATFPNANAAVSASPTDLSNGYVPVGGIVMWSGDITAIPANWHICDGTSGTPDLRDKFVMGAGSTYAANAVGGSLVTQSDGGHIHTAGSSYDGTHTHTGSATDAGGAHDHGAATGAHSLSVGEIPNDSTGSVITFGVFQYQSIGGWSAAGHTHTITPATDHIHTFTAVADGYHTHSITVNSDGSHTHAMDPQPYHALAYIMRIT